VVKFAAVIAVVWLLLSGSGTAMADVWSEPHPFRREALIDGRAFEYDSRSFINRLSYQKVFTRPADQDGMFGTAGSVSSTELYLDIAMQKTLRFDDEHHAIRVNYRRAEDFDGYFDRQKVGYGLNIADWRLGVSGDVRADKAETDVYWELDWAPSATTLWRVNMILPDAFLNQKGQADDEYIGSAYSGFVEWRQELAGWQWQAVLNATPSIAVLDGEANLRAEGEQQRAMLALSFGQRLKAKLRGEAERTDRDFVFDPDGVADEKTFRRRMHAYTASLQLSDRLLTPTLGLYYLDLEEDGWLGLEQALTARIRHQESYGFFILHHALSERWQWQPTVYLGHSEALREYQEDPDRDGQTNRFQGKLVLPFSYLASADNGGYLTISPSFYLHKSAFGGGNIQLHWPF
jgi:hypothetical protein